MVHEILILFMNAVHSREETFVDQIKDGYINVCQDGTNRKTDYNLFFIITNFSA
jgi:hypothetical protein